MPKLLTALTVIGTAAMLWVGGHILLVGTDDLGLHVLYGAVHHLEEIAHDAAGALGGLVAWLVNTLASALLGLVVGVVIVVVMSLTFHRRKAGPASGDREALAVGPGHAGRRVSVPCAVGGRRGTVGTCTRGRPTARCCRRQRRRADRARLADEVVDVLVIGGGVTGAGAALDAASRGLSVGLLEARDWASGTSSRSSKLIHGGLRYLEQLAFPLVHEALSERARLVQTIAPHLVTPLPFLLPLTRPVWQRAYFGAGVALYDVLGAAHEGRPRGARPPAPVPEGDARGVPGAARRRRPRGDPVLGRPGGRRPAHARRRPHRGRLRRAGALQRPRGRACSGTATGRTRRSSASGWPT